MIFYYDAIPMLFFCKQMLEELHWHFNKYITTIEDFKHSSYGYTRPYVVASIIVYAAKLRIKSILAVPLK